MPVPLSGMICAPAGVLSLSVSCALRPPGARGAKLTRTVQPAPRANVALRQSVGLGKFQACLMQPMANLHYVLAPVGMLQKKDLPPRWGLLAYGEAGVTVVVRAEWQECARTEFVESAIARTLTGDIYRADDRAISSVNREIFAQQQQFATRIRSIRPQIVLAPLPGEPGDRVGATPASPRASRGEVP